MLLTWSNGVGRAGNDDIMVDIADKPDLSFDFDALYYEPGTGMRIVIMDGAQITLTDEECEICDAEAAAIIAAADYPVQTYDEDGVYRGPMLKSEAVAAGMGYTLDAPDHPASKRVPATADGAWQRVVAVIMDSGLLREMPEGICQLCMLTFTAEEWADFSRPATPYETWDFATETWADRRALADVQAEARALIRRVMEDVRNRWLDGIPDFERQTWQRQEAEASAWTADAAAPTSFIDAALAGRTVSKADYCTEILANAARAWVLLAHAHNLQWTWFDKIVACTTPQEVDALMYAFGDEHFDAPEGV